MLIDIIIYGILFLILIALLIFVFYFMKLHVENCKLVLLIIRKNRAKQVYWTWHQKILTYLLTFLRIPVLQQYDVEDDEIRAYKNRVWKSFVAMLIALGFFGLTIFLGFLGFWLL